MTMRSACEFVPVFLFWTRPYQGIAWVLSTAYVCMYVCMHACMYVFIDLLMYWNDCIAQAGWDWARSQQSPRDLRRLLGRSPSTAAGRFRSPLCGSSIASVQTHEERCQRLVPSPDATTATVNRPWILILNYPQLSLTSLTPSYPSLTIP